MNHPNIWQSVCKFLEPKEILRLRVLSSKHRKVGEDAAKDRVIRLNNAPILRHTFAWIISCVRMKEMQPSRSVYTEEQDQEEEWSRIYDKTNCVLDALSNQVAYKYSLDVDGRCRNDFFHAGYADIFDEADPLISHDVRLSDIVYLEFDLYITNPAGPNTDLRGTLYPDVELGDFHESWKWHKGFMNIRKLADGFFRLKSHKFENWYELVHADLVPGYAVSYTTYGHKYRHEDKTHKYTSILISPEGETQFSAHLSVDHGS